MKGRMILTVVQPDEAEEIGSHHMDASVCGRYKKPQVLSWGSERLIGHFLGGTRIPVPWLVKDP